MSPPPRQILRTSKECNYLLRRMLSSRAQPGSPASAGFALAGVEERGIRFCVVMEKADSSRQKLALPMTTTQTKDLAGRSCRVVIPVSTCPAGPLLVMTIHESRSTRCAQCLGLNPDQAKRSLRYWVPRAVSYGVPYTRLYTSALRTMACTYSRVSVNGVDSTNSSTSRKLPDARQSSTRSAPAL